MVLIIQIKTMKKSILLCLITFLVFEGCTVKKRAYTKGYYIDWAFMKRDKDYRTRTHKEHQVVENAERLAVAEIETSEQKDGDGILVLAAADEKNGINFAKKSVFNLEPECGDVIVFRSGDSLKAKVLEITEDVIRYKRCDNLEGPLFTVSKGKVASIQYLNGLKEAFKAEATAVSSSGSVQATETKKPLDRSRARIHPLALIAFIFAVLGFLLPIPFTIASLLIAPTALKRIAQWPARYKGESLVKAAKIVSWIIVGILTFFILLLILAVLLAA